MKGLVFGNSHVGAVRLGWQTMKRAEIEFYSIPGGGGPHLKLVDGRLFPDRSARQVVTSIASAETDGLDLSQFDYLVFCSLGLAAVREDFPGHILRQLSLATLSRTGADDALAVSGQFLEKAVQEELARYGAVAAVRSAQSVFDGPILCATCPLPVQDKLENGHPLIRTYGQDRCAAFLSWLSAAQHRILTDLAQSIGPNVRILGLPDPDWAAAGRTPVEYLGKMGDPWHMNGAYGRLVLGQAFAALETA